MNKYEVIRACTFKRRLWLKGEMAEFDEGEAVPEHFRPLNPIVEAKNVLEKRKQEFEVPKEVVEQEILLAETPEEFNNPENMTVEALRRLAESYGLEVPAKAKKADIIALIRGE